MMLTAFFMLLVAKPAMADILGGQEVQDHRSQKHRKREADFWKNRSCRCIWFNWITKGEDVMEARL